MPDSELTAVQKEAYVLSSSHLVTLHTLEIRHPDFLSPIRIVRDQRDLVGKLESDAPANAGENVTFTALWFEFIPPELGEDPDPTFDIKVDNVSGILIPYLELASASTEPIEVTYRMFSWNHITQALNNLDEPSAEPLHMEVFKAGTQAHAAMFTITMAPIANRPFPKEKYTTSQFPGLNQ